MLADWNIKSASKTGSINRTLTATILAAIMHLTGALVVIFWNPGWFLMLTPFNLMVMFFLLIWTLPEKSKIIYGLFIATFATGIIIEIIGVKTGALFGNYEYGNSLGLKIGGVPILIGINWFIIIYASGMLAGQLQKKFAPYSSSDDKHKFRNRELISIVIIGGLIATLFDVIMEPAAVKLGFWSWSNGTIPLRNYVSWFLISAALLFFFRKLPFKDHAFAIHLLIIQAIFFLVLNFR